ncbi:MAG: quinolinate synthase NadA [Parachlamydiales bacterium]|nr:quinolinate synthase NadA [Parachlamydiales bacterium]
MLLDELYQILKNVRVDNPICQYTPQKCALLLPYINKIRALKEKNNALVLAHSYVHSDIIYGVADHSGDSYELAKIAKETDSSIILFAGVRFMAETAKILNPHKCVIDPNPNSSCTLADSITEEDVHRLREKYPHHTFVCYINTSAGIKALCDVCVTSSNVYTVVAKIPNDKIFFLPDRYMGENVKQYLQESKIDKQFLYYHGKCDVHEKYESAHIDLIKNNHPHTMVIAHPECKKEVVQKADMVGSTSQMMRYVQQHPHKDYLILTECGISSRIQIENPQANIVGTCMLCSFMRANSLPAIISALENPSPSQIIEIDKNILIRAKTCIDAMFSYGS